jgi:hypothetical protein
MPTALRTKLSKGLFKIFCIPNLPEKYVFATVIFTAENYEISQSSPESDEENTKLRCDFHKPAVTLNV